LKRLMHSVIIDLHGVQDFLLFIHFGIKLTC